MHLPPVLPVHLLPSLCRFLREPLRPAACRPTCRAVAPAFSFDYESWTPPLELFCPGPSRAHLCDIQIEIKKQAPPDMPPPRFPTLRAAVVARARSDATDRSRRGKSV